MRKDLKPLVHFDDFLKLDIRVGVIIEAAVFEKARKPAYRLKVHFGEMIGVKNSSAQICGHYRPEDLIGKQVLGVVNFPVKQIGNFSRRFSSSERILKVASSSSLLTFRLNRAASSDRA